MIVYRLMSKVVYLSNEKKIKLLRITVDNKVSFGPHRNEVFKKVMALLELENLFHRKKLRVIRRESVISQFSYCPLVWMYIAAELWITKYY